MAEDSSLDSSFPVVHKGNGNLVLRTVEDGEKEQPDSSSSSSNLLDSKMLPTGRLEFSCCSKKGCQNVFNKTIGRKNNPRAEKCIQQRPCPRAEK